EERRPEVFRGVHRGGPVRAQVGQPDPDHRLRQVLRPGARRPPGHQPPDEAAHKHPGLQGAEVHRRQRPQRAHKV
ncbi:MAG: DNA-binding protein HBsu, partial [uncultured Rubrobacteraceae bacterium]